MRHKEKASSSSVLDEIFPGGKSARANHLGTHIRIRTLPETTMAVTDFVSHLHVPE